MNFVQLIPLRIMCARDTIDINSKRSFSKNDDDDDEERKEKRRRRNFLNKDVLFQFLFNIE